MIIHEDSGSEALRATARALLAAHAGDSAHHVAFAPGRVNLIGEYTDFNQGFVLPCALEVGTAVAVYPREDSKIVAVSADRDTLHHDDFYLSENLAPAPAGASGNYLRGVTAAMIRAGYRLSGATLAIVGNVPQGAGLSSSASLSVAVARALLSISNPDTADAATLAAWAQWSEHHFAGCRCGIMDPMAAAAAESGVAMLLDCRSLEYRSIALPKTMAVLIAHSGVRRQLIDGEYNRRREQCEAVVAASGVAALRDLNSEGLEALRSKISPTEFRRARHVVSENARVLTAVRALEEGDLETLGRVLHASHVSLRDDFEVTVSAVNALVACLEASIRRHADGQGGARMTGGGFGGCVLAVMDAAALPQVENDLRRWLCTHVDGPPLVLRLGAPQSDSQSDAAR